MVQGLGYWQGGLPLGCRPFCPGIEQCAKKKAAVSSGFCMTEK
jgi:hypothetical protein